MGNFELRALLKQFCQDLDESRDRCLVDQQLLQAFTANRDQEAFAALVRRHGPLVLGVCRRVLQAQHDAEDAFQATFLVLARKASSIRKQQAVASWLYGVAYRLASKAKLQAARRRSHEREATPPSPSLASDPTWSELRTVLDEELMRLPEKFRAPLLLCYLDGKTQDEAARQLDWSLGTFRRRLDQGRELLRQRLTRRGVALSAALFPALLAQQAVAGVPVPLITTTCQSALLFVSGQAAGTLAAPIVALAEGFMKSMLFAKLKIAAGLLLLIAVCGVSLGVWSQRSSGGDAPPVPDAAEGQAEALDQAHPEKARADADQPTFPRRLFAISVNNYAFLDKVGFGAGERSVDKLVKQFADRLSIPADQVVILSDAMPAGSAKPSLPELTAEELARLSDDEVKRLLERTVTAPAPPTKAIIERNISRFLDSSGLQDRLILMFVGHAVEIDNQAYLVPLEGERDNKESLIPLKWVYERLGACKARQKVLLIDVCRHDPDAEEARGHPMPMGQQLDTLLANPPTGVQVLTACTAGQFSYELDNKRKAGVQGGIVLNLLPQLQLKDVQQRPQDPLPMAALAKALVPRTRYLAQAFLDKEQTPRLNGTEAQTQLAYDPKAPATPRFKLELTGNFASGIASRAQIESLFKEIAGIPPIRPGGGVVAFEKDILPVLQAKCAKCHIEPDRKKGGLDLRTVASIKKGGQEGPAIVPNDLKKSYLWEMVETNMMPPKGEPQVTAAEKATIRQWIMTGAKDNKEAAFATDLPGLQYDVLPPFPAGLLRAYADDGKNTPLREKVREAIALLKNPQHNEPFPVVFHRKFDPANQQQVNLFQNSLAQTQQEMGLRQFQLDTVLEELDILEKDRGKEGKRWQALFDFVRARLAARIAYMYEYNVKLGEMRKERPAFDPTKHTGWELVPVAKITDRDAEKYAKRASAFLEQLATDHAATPWELLAKRERHNPLGLEWRAR
ncbi:hypothetical protein AYO44_11505 [Planctomycetaceae bacterium SCGC AG-212-F19]|nr:hypothetical protein AYO44_11505 [Planctomycetaceae bacterium SCGC AG-212-F19]